MSKLLFNQKGVVLVIALVLMSILFATALSFAYFILADINKANKLDNAIVAYYAADAGLERSLFLLRKFDDISSIANLTSDLQAGTLTNSAKWSTVSSTDYESVFLRQRLNYGIGPKIYILGRENGGPNLTKSIFIKWETTTDEFAKLNVVFTQLKPQNDDQALVNFTDQHEILSSAQCLRLKDEDIGIIEGGFTSDYVVEFRALYGTIKRLIVKAYNSTDCDQANPADDNYNPQGITNITLQSEGTFGNVRQRIIAHMPPRDPSSGILGFVLFSDNDIKKGYE